MARTKTTCRKRPTDSDEETQLPEDETMEKTPRRTTGGKNLKKLKENYTSEKREQHNEKRRERYKELKKQKEMEKRKQRKKLSSRPIIIEEEEEKEIIRPVPLADRPDYYHYVALLFDERLQGDGDHPDWVEEDFCLPPNFVEKEDEEFLEEDLERLMNDLIN